MEEHLTHKAPLYFLFALAVFIVVVGVVVLTLKPIQKNIPSSLFPIPTTNPVSETANPFKQDTAVQNPFGSTESADKEYTNPFEKLR